MSLNEINNEDVFENFLKYDLDDENGEDDEDEEDDVDEFYDALSESNCDRLKRKNERLKVRLNKKSFLFVVLNL